MHFRRMLMNAVDDALTSTATSAPAPAEAPAGPVNTNPTTTISAADITAALKADPSLRNMVMASLRRGGALTGPNPASDATPTTQPTPPTTTAPAQPPQAANVHQELQRFRALDRAVMAAGVKVSQTQIDRMERAFLAENPQDAGRWAAEYVADMFASAVPPPAPPATQQTPAPAPTQTITTPTHATSVPTPPPPVVDTSARRIIDMTDGERRELESRLGRAKFVERYRQEMASVRVALRK